MGRRFDSFVAASAGSSSRWRSLGERGGVASTPSSLSERGTCSSSPQRSHAEPGASYPSSTTDIAVTGIAHTRFGKLSDDTVETLVVQVVRDALADAGLEPGRVDEVDLSQFNAGLTPLAFPSSLAMQADDALFGAPMTRVENACASGSAAVHQGIRAMRSGCAKTVLVIGVEKMTHAGADVVGAALLGADFELAGTESTTGFAGLFARVAEAYADRHGDVTEALAMIAAKNHANGMKNPNAQLHKEFSVEFCRTESDKNPRVAGPLKRTDCSPVSDGAAALILQDTTEGLARITGFGHANDFLPAAKKDPSAFAGTRIAIERALAMANTDLDALSLAEVHDCFTIAELVVYEAMGLTEPGQGRRALDEGWVFPDGKLPVNVSGGLKSKGHPVGATGVSQHVLAALQLSGRADAMQVAGASKALVHNMGGLAVAN
ncbi:thiolase domain-containing protein [Mariniluteicoccus flavus]